MEETVHVSEVIHYPEDKEMITIPFNFSDTTKYASITEANIEKRITISINGKVVYTPVVKTRLGNGACHVLLPRKQVEQLFPNIDINQLFHDK